MTTTVGVIIEYHNVADPLWNQTDRPLGRHGTFALRGTDPSADHVLVFTSPAREPHRPRPPLGLRLRGGEAGSEARRRWRLEAAYRDAGLDRDRTTVLFYEPPTYVSDLHYEVARERARAVYGPDPRASHPCVLPVVWRVELDRDALVALEPPEPVVPLVSVTSGKSFLPGHRERLDFLARLRRANVPLELFGYGLPSELRSRGELNDKISGLLGARMTLAIENYAEGDLYVTEKLWDPLLMWSLPLYYGSAAADPLIPPDAFIRLPDLGEAGVEVVRDAVARPELWNERLDAVAEARRRILGELRAVEWLRRHVVEGG